MTTFALIGGAGYVASRHLGTMKAVGGNLLAGYDQNDLVRVIDRYFSEARYFKEFELFEHHIEQLRRHENGVNRSPFSHQTICMMLIANFHLVQM